MSNGNLTTQLDRPYAQQPATRAAAVRVISGQDQAEMLLDMLGLVEPDRGPGERPDCPACGRPRQKDKVGGWRACQRKACIGGEAS